MNSRERNFYGAAQVGELVVAVFQRLESVCQLDVVISIGISAGGLNNMNMGGRTYIQTRRLQQRADRQRSLVGLRH
jgi:hypothetical protein